MDFNFFGFYYIERKDIMEKNIKKEYTEDIITNKLFF